MMNQPMARVVKLEYRDMNPKVKMDASAFIVHLRAPDGEMYEHPLENPEWMVHNPTLQFMALYNFKPSDIEGTSSPSQEGDSASEPSGSDTSMNVEDANWLLPVAPDGDGGYLLAAHVLEGGIEALEDAEWFSASDDSDGSDGDHSGPHGGGGPDPSTGNRGGVEEPSEESEDTGVSAELTPEKNAGVEVKVE